MIKFMLIFWIGISNVYPKGMISHTFQSKELCIENAENIAKSLQEVRNNLPKETSGHEYMMLSPVKYVCVEIKE